MRFKDYIRQRALSLELWLSNHSGPLERLPLLRGLHRDVTAEIKILYPQERTTLGFSVEFQSPYFHQPLDVGKSQIGTETGEGFEPSAFRFFDWHSWVHIQGSFEWHGERQVQIEDEKVAVISGFSYRITELATSPENFGLRLAEGVEGHISVLVDHSINRVRFQPQYWILEPRNQVRKVTPIKDTELAMLIVSLSELGGGNGDTFWKAVDRLEQWANHKRQKNNPEKVLLELLTKIRDWGPVGMEPMFIGVKELLQRLRVADQERILFEFYADNWGIRNNQIGRSLAIKVLESLGTARALITLETISEYVKNHSMPPDELELIRDAIQHIRKTSPEAKPAMAST